MVNRLGRTQHISTLVGWRYLVGRHTTERGVCPTCTFAGTLIILLILLPQTYTG